MGQIHFIVTCRTEARDLLCSCVRSIRQCYPDSLLTVVSDGGTDDLSDLMAEFGGVFVRGAHLKRLDAGGGWWKRFFSLAVSTPADFIVKIDPDTEVRKPLSLLPEADVGGTLQRDSAIQGGFQIFRTSVAQRILSSGILDDPNLAIPETWSLSPGTMRYALTRREISTDYVLFYVIRRLELTTENLPEVDSQWGRLTPFRPDARVIHPVRIP